MPTTHSILQESEPMAEGNLARPLNHEKLAWMMRCCDFVFVCPGEQAVVINEKTTFGVECDTMVDETK